MIQRLFRASTYARYPLPPQPRWSARRISRIGGDWVLLDYRLWPDGSVRDVCVLAASPENVFDISDAMALQAWQFETPSNVNQHHQLSVAFDAQ